ncbi:ABC transporter ATP-binding protein [Actinopolymorpha alba]|uniref:ABC transporter ATP-binding protein n=1 Tax=Actinopolymorpha alba TaxID=533267 RepID=UPI0003690661|nr:ABC transporter ATP-binding protein [Actinopolymorpha alba]
MTTDEKVVLEVDGLRMRYGSVDVLHDVTFQARHGEVLALLGPNGAGKTTTIEILEGFRTRSQGQVKVLGTDPEHGDERWRARLGVVLQSWRDHGKWRVGEFLAHLGTYYAAYATPRIQRPWNADELIKTVGLTEHAGKKLRTLSGGQRRRLDVAIGLVGRPELLFLDEPTSSFDPQARQMLHDLVRRLVGTGETTVLLTTHDLAEAEKLADRILVLNGGRIIADGTVGDLAQRIAGQDEVRWLRGGQRFVERTTDSTAFARELFARYGDDIQELEVHRASLEQTYLSLVHQAESTLEVTR